MVFEKKISFAFFKIIFNQICVNLIILLNIYSDSVCALCTYPVPQRFYLVKQRDVFYTQCVRIPNFILNEKNNDCIYNLGIEEKNSVFLLIKFLVGKNV